MFQNSTMKWLKLIDHFIDSKRARKDQKTVKWYEARLSHWLIFCRAQGLRPGRVTVADLDQFAGQLKTAGLAYSTRAGTITAVKALFRFLRKNRVIKFNPFEEFEPIPVERSEIEPIPLDYCYKMIRAAERAGTPCGIRDVAMMRLLLTTGARRAELVTLTLPEIDLIHGQAILVGKFGHRRRVPLIQTTITALEIWLSQRPATPVRALFVAIRSGQALRPSAINERLIVWRRAAGLPAVSVSPHKWRHRFATELKRAGDPFTLQRILGHMDISTTQRYIHASPEEIRDLVIRFGPDLSSAGIGE